MVWPSGCDALGVDIRGDKIRWLAPNSLQNRDFLIKLVPRRGRRTSQIIVALQGVSLRVKRRSGPESGPYLCVRSE